MKYNKTNLLNILCYILICNTYESQTAISYVYTKYLIPILLQIPDQKPDVLDIALVKLPQLLTEIYNLNDLSSDHNPILLQISDSPVKRPLHHLPPCCHWYQNYSNE